MSKKPDDDTKLDDQAVTEELEYATQLGSQEMAKVTGGSADMSHAVDVVTGLSLPNIAETVWGGPRYEAENDLNQFRSLSSTNQVVFPETDE